MISKKGKLNLILITTILGSVIFYSYNLSKNKGSIRMEEKQALTEKNNSDLQKGITKFQDVEYKSTDEMGRVYITKGQEAFLDNKKPDIIQLNVVYSYTILKDGTKLNVRSKKADYYKNTKNIKYYQNVNITNKDIIITSEIASFLSKENIIKLEKNVIFKDTNNLIKSDIAEFNTITNDIQIYMKKKPAKVYGQQKQQ